jgi:hypothetical protein
MAPKKKETKQPDEVLTRIAIVSEDRCGDAVQLGVWQVDVPPRKLTRSHRDAGASLRSAVRSARRAAQW